MKPFEFLKFMYNKFPRQFATPIRKDVYSFEDLVNRINKYNEVSRCFCTVHDYSYGNREPIIDKIFIDIDSSQKDAQLVHKLLMDNDIYHTILFSGKGFHIYVFTELSRDYDGYKGFYDFIESETGAKIDCQVKDIARISTIPFTYNVRRHRFCIPLRSERLMNSTYDEIKEKAMVQFYDVEFYGTKLVKLPEYKKYTNNKVYAFIPEENMTIDIKGDKVLSLLPECVSYHLKKGKPNHKQRGTIITCLFEYGMSNDMVKKTLKKYLEEDKYHHCVEPSTVMYKGKRCEGQVDYIEKKINNGRWFFPSDEKLKEERFCNIKNCKHVKLYRE